MKSILFRAVMEALPTGVAMERIVENISVLLVDDEYVIRKVLSNDLRSKGFSVTDVAGGADAIHALQSNQFHVIISDLMMEGVDGFDVLKAAMTFTPLTKVIVMTGYGDIRTAIHALQLGAEDFLLKPFETEELVFRVLRCFEKRNLLQQVMKKADQLEREIERCRLVEEELRESEKRFLMAMDATSSGVWDHNLLTGETYLGDNWYRTLGYGDGTKPNLQTILHPDDRERVLDSFDAHIRGNTPVFEAEFRLRHGSGSWQRVISRGKVMAWDKQGNATRIVGIIRDLNKGETD